jgi:hypothetical protein
MIIVDDLAGQPCPRVACEGILVVKDSKQTDDGRHMKRFYGCNLCGCRPEDNKRVVPIEKSAARR